MKLSPRQAALLDTLLSRGESQKLLHGPVGTAKTTLGALWLLTLSQSSWNAHYGLLGYTEHQAVNGPIAELQKICPAVHRLSARVYSMPSSCGAPNKLHIFTANKAGDHQRIKSYNLSGGYVDEITEIPEDAYGSFVGRMRRGRGVQVVSTTNPKGQAHWVYRRFIDDTRDDALKARTLAVRTVHADNPSLHPDYVQNLEVSFRGHELSRMVHGEWVDVMGAAFPYCIRAITDELPDMSRVVSADIGLDVGYSQVSHAVLVLRDDAGMSWVAGEWVHDHQRRGKLSAEQQITAVMRELAPDSSMSFTLNTLVIDRSAVDVVEAARYLLAGSGVQIYQADDIHTVGVSICEDWAALGALRICGAYAPVLCEELRRVVWCETAALLGFDRLDKNVTRHGADAFRYVISTTHINEQGGMRVWNNRRKANYAL